MGKKLYVGNLPYETTEDQLKEMFAPSGAVASARIITDKFSGRSKGFGFVEMTTDEEAAAAITKLNGTQMGARKIVVNEAKPQEDRGPRPGGGGGGWRGGGGGQRSGGGGGWRR
ncbi:MAG: RNA-binding protein [Elusimicrobia bacterium]|nr:RNA-binding protein [Elusimicrobiota bacterium]